LQQTGVSLRCVAVAVVFILSKDFLQKVHPMGELLRVLLRQRRERDTGHPKPVGILPVYYNVRFEEAKELIGEWGRSERKDELDYIIKNYGSDNGSPASAEQIEATVAVLNGILSITAIRPDQVCSCCPGVWL
jgi:hypothetical protein